MGSRLQTPNAAEASHLFFAEGVWRTFAWMMHNSHDASAYFSIPPEQVVEIGRRLEV